MLLNLMGYPGAHLSGDMRSHMHSCAHADSQFVKMAMSPPRPAHTRDVCFYEVSMLFSFLRCNFRMCCSAAAASGCGFWVTFTTGVRLRQSTPQILSAASGFLSMHMFKFQDTQNLQRQKYLNASEYPVSMETEIKVNCLMTGWF